MKRSIDMDRQYIEQQMQHTFLDFLSTQDWLKNPLVISKSGGVYVWDIDGKKYFDAIGGVFVASLGHQHPRLMECMHKQLEILTLAPPLLAISDVTLKFVEKIGMVTPGDLNFVKTFSGGSESTEAAMKFTRQYHKQTGNPDKMKVVSNYLGYHGATFGALSAGGGNRKFKFEPQMPGFVKCYNPKQLRDMYPSWEETCRAAADLVRLTIESEDPRTVGAFIVEPICNTAGIITPTEEYYQMIRKTCDDYGVVLIFDEVLTGIGKTGDMFAAQTYGVTPDIICSGKGLSSGVLPLGCMMASDAMAKAFEGPASEEKFFMHGHTYANFPLGSALATEVINTIEEDHLIDHARVIGAKLRNGLEGLKKYGCIREVRGKGMLIGVELVEDPVTNKPFPKDNKLGIALKTTTLQNGLVMRIDPDWFAIAPPLITTEEQADELLELIEKSLKDALEMVSKK